MRCRTLLAIALSILAGCGEADDWSEADLDPGWTDSATGGAAGSGGVSAGGEAGEAGGAGEAGAAGEPNDGGEESSDAGSDPKPPPCCLDKPPGSIPNNGGWNDCPYSGSGRQHAAIDYSSTKGTKIPAGMGGVIQYIKNDGDPKCYNASTGSCSDACLKSGDFIVLKSACGDPKKSGNDFYVRYHHINGVKAGIKVGSVVKAGDIIAFVGDSGCATGAHVHLQTATFEKGTYKVGKLPVFYDCQYLVKPSTRYCK